MKKLKKLFKRLVSLILPKKTPSGVPDMLKENPQERVISSHAKAALIQEKIEELIELVEPQFNGKTRSSKQMLATALSKAILVMLENRYVYQNKTPHVIKGKFHA